MSRHMTSMHTGERWVGQPFDSWLEFPRALWRLWKTRRHWL